MKHHPEVQPRNLIRHRKASSLLPQWHLLGVCFLGFGLYLLPNPL
ncbi:hypothetical protein LYNGBM3L_30900 [Moorena producens 3L]|uniref:Uncharacterized protein n=1 Tax=Moorena producens 3L TaxID=489825 RepID=F4XTQ0_9CYAN|nr:hypothetical protein LYNGBM3L_30900 [Moorena producens 3L]